MSFSGPYNLASGGFLAAPSLISNCSKSALWNSGKVMEAGVLPTRNGGQKKEASMTGSLTGPRSVSGAGSKQGKLSTYLFFSKDNLANDIQQYPESEK